MFTKRVEELLRTHSLLLCDFELLKRTLVENPKSGEEDLTPTEKKALRELINDIKGKKP